MKTASTILILLVTFSLADAQPTTWSRTSSIGYPGVFISESPQSVAQSTTDDGLFVAGMMAASPGGDFAHPFLAKYDIDFNIEWARVYDPIRFDLMWVFATSDGGAALVGTKTENDVTRPVHMRVDGYGGIVGGGTLPYTLGDVLIDADITDDDGLVLLFNHSATIQTVIRATPDGQMVWDTNILAVLGGPWRGGAVDFYGAGTHVFADDNGVPSIALLDENGDGDFGCVYPEAPSVFILDGYWVDMTTGIWMAGVDADGYPILLRFREGFYYDYAVTWPDMGPGEALNIEVTSDVGFVVTGNADGYGWTTKFSHECVEEWTVRSEPNGTFADVIEPMSGCWVSVGADNTGNQNDILLQVAGIPEIEPPVVQIWLYQPWYEGFTMPRWGGPFEFQTVMRNNSAFPADYIVRAELVSHTGTVTQIGMYGQFLPPGETLQDHVLTIPPYVGWGNHAIVGKIGITSDDPLSASSVIFKKGPFPTENLDPFLFGSPEIEVAADDSRALQPDPDAALCLTDVSPNPFNAATTVTLALTDPANVRVTLYDILGREVVAVANEYLQAGEHRFTVDAGTLASGVYFLSACDASGHLDTRKVVLLR